MQKVFRSTLYEFLKTFAYGQSWNKDYGFYTFLYKTIHCVCFNDIINKNSYHRIWGYLRVDATKKVILRFWIFMILAANGSADFGTTPIA